MDLKKKILVNPLKKKKQKQKKKLLKNIKKK